MSTKSIKGLSI